MHFFFFFIFYLYINEYKYSINLLSEKTDVILNRAKDYYKNYSDKIKKQAREKYNIPKEKIDKIEYEKNKYYKITEEKKNKKKRIWKK